MLRYESSNQLGNRGVTAPCEIGGVAVEAGTLVTLCIGAANRDPAQFPDPERFDIGRTPNRHLAFAAGAHQCAGLALARLEGRIAIARFLARFPGYALGGAAGARRPGAVPRLPAAARAAWMTGRSGREKYSLPANPSLPFCGLALAARPMPTQQNTGGSREDTSSLALLDRTPP